MIDLILDPNESTRIVVNRATHSILYLNDNDNSVDVIFEPVEPVRKEREVDVDN